MRAWVSILIVCLVMPATAHVENHEGDRDRCEVDLPPHGHGIGDGHAHTHDPETGLNKHLPCNQSGMARPSFENALPIPRIELEDAVIGGAAEELLPVILDTEALLMDVQEFATGTNLIIVGDDALARYAELGIIDGTGTTTDPYIIEGMHIRNVMYIKDTSKCIVVRDNIVHSRALLGPLVLPDAVEDLRAVQAGLEAQREGILADLEAERQALMPDDDRIALLEDQQETTEAELEVVASAAQEAAFRVGQTTADTVYELAQKLAADARALLAPAAGRMILDWNGQCVHVYNNIVEDLRINRNTARAGFATGGVVEDNRFFHIGQIRHYDGEFRQNVVGYRDHLWGILPEIKETRDALHTWRAINGDGFNQGWYHHNLIFGSVDLDFHGHHHGNGFFAPESHYHGNDPRIAYMLNPDGSCKYQGWDYGQERSTAQEIEAMLNELGRTIEPDEVQTGLFPMPDERCLTHHDHRARWTSANFEHNIVIDPFGYGVRYEDRNHAGDDRIAASEHMQELNVPHVHRTHIRLSDNVVLGSMWVDVFNSPTVDVWSDDYSEVRYDTSGAIVGAIEHLGARVISSHPERNTGWLDIEDNVVYTLDKHHNTPGFHYGWAAYQINHLSAGEVAFNGNQAYFLPYHLAPAQATDVAFLDDLSRARTASPDETQLMVADLGAPRDQRPTSFAFVFHELRDANVVACDNLARGFDVGFYAWNGIMEDTAMSPCNNDYGDAPFPEYIRHTSYQDRPDMPLAAMLRSLSNDTSFEPVMRPVIDQSNNREAFVAMWQDILDSWAEQQMANVDRAAQQWMGHAQRTADNTEAWATRSAEMYIDNSNRAAQQQLNNIDRWVGHHMYWADYTAARHMGWVDYQVGRNMDHADYQAARSMAYADWANMVAAKYLHSAPLA